MKLFVKVKNHCFSLDDVIESQFYMTDLMANTTAASNMAAMLTFRLERATRFNRCLQRKLKEKGEEKQPAF